MESYSQLASVLTNRTDLHVPISAEAWAPYAEKASNLNLEKSELVLSHIINYGCLTIPQSPNPYNVKQLSDVGGIIVDLHALPPPLQHILVALLERI